MNDSSAAKYTLLTDKVISIRGNDSGALVINLMKEIDRVVELYHKTPIVSDTRLDEFYDWLKEKLAEKNSAKRKPVLDNIQIKKVDPPVREFISSLIMSACLGIQSDYSLVNRLLAKMKDNLVDTGGREKILNAFKGYGENGKTKDATTKLQRFGE